MKKDKGVIVLIAVAVLLVVINGFLYWFNYARLGKSLNILPGAVPTAVPTWTANEEAVYRQKKMESYRLSPTPYCEKGGRQYLVGDVVESNEKCMGCTCRGDKTIDCRLKAKCEE